MMMLHPQNRSWYNHTAGQYICKHLNRNYILTLAVFLVEIQLHVDMLKPFHVAIMGRIWSVTALRDMLGLFSNWFVIQGPEMYWENIPHHQQLALFAQSRLGPWIHADPTICVPQLKSRLIQPRNIFPSLQLSRLWWTCVHCSFRFLLLAGRRETWCSSHSPRGSMCWAPGKFFCSAQLLQSGYLSYCSPAVSSEQSGHSLTSLINNVFLSTEPLLTVVCENPRRSKRLAPTRLAPTITSQSKSLGSFWCLMWTFTDALDLYLHNLMKSTAAIWLAEEICKYS